MTMNIGPTTPLARATAVTPAASLAAAPAAAEPAAKPAAAAPEGPKAADPLGGAAQSLDLDAIAVPADTVLEANNTTTGTGGGGSGTRGGPRRSA